MNNTTSTFADYAPTESRFDGDDFSNATSEDSTIGAYYDEDNGDDEEKRDDSQEKISPTDISLPTTFPTTIDSELVQRAFEALKKENAKLKSKYDTACNPQIWLKYIIVD